MMNSDMMEEVLGNPEKMEQARQAILDNPTLKQAMAQLPGFSEMVREVTWVLLVFIVMHGET